MLSEESPPGSAELFEPRRPTCPYFYKYSNPNHLEWLRGTLLDHTVYFPSHPELNDPLDGWPPFKPLCVEEVIAFLANTLIRRSPGSDPKWLADEIATIDFNTRRYYYDPLHGAQWLMGTMSEMLKRQTAKNRIYSLSMAGDSDYLWEKYGGNHTGYCLEFANDGVFSRAREVDYAEDRIAMDVN